MNKDELLKKSADLISELALKYVVKDLEDKYGSFLEMLFVTERFWGIPHFIALQINKQSSKGILSLCLFLQRAISEPKVYTKHVENCEELLSCIYPVDCEIREQFRIYKNILKLETKTAESVREIVKGKRFANDWLDTYL